MESSTHRTSWYAMGTRWELTMVSERPYSYLQSVAEEVTAEVERVEQLLSLYRDDSDVTELNATAAMGPIPADPRLVRLLKSCSEIASAMGGAFDPTIAPLLRAWGFVGNSGEMPTVSDIEAARAIVGMAHVAVDYDLNTVLYDSVGVQLEFGAIGKGYAIDRVVELMRDEYGIETALIHGGTSTIYALGSPPDSDRWSIAVQRPNAPAGETFVEVPLTNRALSVSAPHGKWFEQNGRRYGHILDPRTGYPAAGAVVAVVATDSAAESDALSTALLVLGEEGIPIVRAYRPDSYVLLGSYEADGSLHVVTDGSL